MTALTLHFEPTPNPASYKLVLNRTLIPHDTPFECTREVDVHDAPLPHALFKHFPIERVFIMHDFITLHFGSPAVFEAQELKVLEFIKSYVEAGGKVLHARHTAPATAQTPISGGGDVTIETKIKQVLDEYIKPAIARDGGAITFHSFEEGVVRLNLQGACSGCPSATITLQAGVEQLLKSMIAEVKSVEATPE